MFILSTQFDMHSVYSSVVFYTTSYYTNVHGHDKDKGVFNFI